MTDAGGGSCSSGVGAGGGNEWELVSLTASTYAAAPGPVPPFLPEAAHRKTELPPNPPAAVNSAIFMSQHFKLPAAPEAHNNALNESQEEESTPAILPRSDQGATDNNLNISCPENSVVEQDGSSVTRRSDFHKDLSTTLGLEDGNLLADAGSALTVQGGGGVPVLHHNVSVVAVADAAGIMDSSSQPAHVVHVGSGVACVATNKGPSSRIPCEARAWWNKRFRFLRSNSNEPLTFRFIFVAPTIVGHPGAAREVAAQA